MILGFIEEQRAKRRAVESVCKVLREQGVQIAARTYRAWKHARPSSRDITDAVIVDALRSKISEPEGMYGRRKMTAHLLRERYRQAVRADRSALPGLIDIIFRNPVITVSSVQRALTVSQPTASGLIKKAAERGWVRSMGRWGRGGKERWLASEVWRAVASQTDQDSA